MWEKKHVHKLFSDNKIICKKICSNLKKDAHGKGSKLCVCFRHI